MYKLRNIIVFIDSYNDVDNILPFIDYVLSNQKAKITLYKTKESNFSGCEDHLNYLKDTYGLIPVSYDGNFRKYYIVFSSIYKKLKDLLREKQTPYYLPFKVIFSRIRFIVSYLTEVEVRKNKKNLDAEIILMDFGKEITFYGSAIVKIFQNTNTAVVGYMHGFSIYTNTNTLQKDNSELSPLKETILRLAKPVRERVYFDRYVVGNEQRDTLFHSSQQNFEKKYLDRVFETGAIRYTTEWISKYRGNVVTSKNFRYGDEKKINVLLFMSHPQYNVNVDNLMSTMRRLSLCDSINFVYKPHTRNGLDGISTRDFGGYDATNISSLELSSWADVGIVYGSSIAFQLVMDNVPIIMPRYIHSNTTILEMNDACVVADDISDLMNLLKHSIEEISSMINTEKKNNFVDHYIYGDKSYIELMEYFYQSIVSPKLN